MRPVNVFMYVCMYAILRFESAGSYNRPVNVLVCMYLCMYVSMYVQGSEMLDANQAGKFMYVCIYVCLYM